MLQKDAGTGLAFQQDQGEFRDLLSGINLVEVAVVVLSRHKDGVGCKAGPRVQCAVLGRGGEGDVHRAGAQHTQHLGAAAGDDLQPDAGVLVVEGVQIRRQELPGHGVAGADGQSTQQQLLRLGELVLAGSQQPQRVADVLIEHLPLSRQGHAAGGAGKQTGLQSRFQLLDRLAHSRLGDIQVFCRRRDIPGFRHLFKNAVQFQFDCHMYFLRNQ